MNVVSTSQIDDNEEKKRTHTWARFSSVCEKGLGKEKLALSS